MLDTASNVRKCYLSRKATDIINIHRVRMNTNVQVVMVNMVRLQMLLLSIAALRTVA